MSEQRVVKIKLAPLGNRVPKELISGIKKSVGSKFERGTTSNLMGLTALEREHILPFILKIQPSHADWEQRVNKFYSNLTIPVDPDDGTQLNASCRYRKVKDTDGTEVDIPIPENHIDYVKYRQCLVDPTVGKNLDEAKGEGRTFYIEDVFEEKQSRAKVSQMVDQVERAFLKVTAQKADGSFENPETLEAILRSLGVNPIVLDNLDKVETVRKAKDSDIQSIKTYKNNTETRFYKIIADPDLKDKGMLLAFISAGIVTQKGDYILDDDGNVMGSDMTQAVMWLKDNVNSSKVLSYKQRLKEKQKTAIA